MAGPEYLDKDNFEFHYKREDRLAKAPKGVRDRTLHPDKKGGFFNLKKNKSLLIILVDILIVIIFGAVIYPLIANMASSQSLDGYNLKIRGIIYDDTVLASLKIEKNNNPAGENPPVTIKTRFFTSENNSAGFFETELPAETGKTVIVRDSLEYNGDDSSIKVEIILGGKNLILDAALTEE